MTSSARSALAIATARLRAAADACEKSEGWRMRRRRFTRASLPAGSRQLDLAGPSWPADPAEARGDPVGNDDRRGRLAPQLLELLDRPLHRDLGGGRETGRGVAE